MSIDNEKIYNTREVSKLLGVGESTLVKWCLEIEKNGYNFNKGAKNSRLFDIHDIDSLTYFKELIRIDKYTNKEAGVKVSNRLHRNKATGEVLKLSKGQENSLEGKMMMKLEELYEKVSVITQQQAILNEKLDYVLKTIGEEKVIEVRIKNNKSD